LKVERQGSVTSFPVFVLGIMVVREEKTKTENLSL
jgi:hypothetical protein